jgi:NAD(P)-dependent dehydrogenase (short-subunit alcohol dehydrogenase family)
LRATYDRAFGKINIIVNNAGFTFDAMLHKTTDKQFQLMLEVHNAAPFRIIRAAAKYMRLKDGEPRSIVNVSVELANRPEAVCIIDSRFFTNLPCFLASN